MEKGGYIYFMTNKNRTTIYIGVTNDLQRRIIEHRDHINKDSFSYKYNLEYCIYYEYHPSIHQAIDRETQLKKWSRKKKEMLVNRINPQWEDLWNRISRMRM
ncbi:excinuclease ABC subunit C [Bacteroidia bacterium]|nr:excinuclease ABC subunit C [Bacteroidia bacterium]